MHGVAIIYRLKTALRILDIIPIRVVVIFRKNGILFLMLLKLEKNIIPIWDSSAASKIMMLFLIPPLESDTSNCSMKYLIHFIRKKEKSLKSNLAHPMLFF